jgi:hypothetical protein
MEPPQIQFKEAAQSNAAWQPPRHPRPCADFSGVLRARRPRCTGAASRQGPRSARRSQPRSSGLPPLTARLMRQRACEARRRRRTRVSRSRRTPTNRKSAGERRRICGAISRKPKTADRPHRRSLVFKSKRCRRTIFATCQGRSFSCADSQSKSAALRSRIQSTPCLRAPRP